MALIKWMGEDVLEPFREFADFPAEINRVFGRPLFPATWLMPKNGMNRLAWPVGVAEGRS